MARVSKGEILMAEKQTQKELSFTKKVIRVINELKAPKNLYNSFGKYHYRNAEGIMEAVKPLAAKYDLLPNVSDEIVLIGERYYVKAAATITDGEQEMKAYGYAREAEVKKGQDDSQITGAASSYARKYALNGLYLIDDTKDADTDEYKQNEKANTPETIDKTKVEVLNKGIADLTEVINSKSDRNVTQNEVAKMITNKKFLSDIPLNKLDVEQFKTAERYIKELKKAYGNKK